MAAEEGGGIVRRCVPGECERCVAWGFNNKVRCERDRIPPQRDGRNEDYVLGSGWFSTTLGTECFFAAEQLTIEGV